MIFFISKEIYKFLTITTVIGIIWVGIEISILLKAKHYRLVVPFNLSLPKKSIDSFTKDILDPKNTEGYGSRSIITWTEYFDVKDMLISNLGKLRMLPIIRYWFYADSFDITIDYEKRGYIYSVSLENEYSGMKYDARKLIIQLVKILNKFGCLQEYGQSQMSLYPETSLLAEVLANTKTDIDPKLFALNKILIAPTWLLKDQIRMYIEGDLSSLSKDDKDAIEDIVKRESQYNEWLSKAQNDNLDIPLSLLGEYNITAKRKAIFISDKEQLK